MLKKIGLALAALLIAGAALVAWLVHLVGPGPDRAALAATRPDDIPYITQAPPEARGRILAVVTSAGTFEGSGEPTGYELTPLLWLAFGVGGVAGAGRARHQSGQWSALRSRGKLP